MGIKVSAVSTEEREWIPKNGCGQEREGSVEPGGGVGCDKTEGLLRIKLRRRLGAEAMADSTAEGPAAICH